ncbi:Putative prophage phiRv2 integrase [Microbacterium lemovicicum]|uniref:Prophage phiRv2 integrase n=1 Tax=Microbacterium lemovicicum TaxID=1072463 RepID=A0A3Q9J361_9MICO|nr:tyrosine-type recombinase/integrase [Microbacterium lemovicicum]AZS36803.1 Putative prophage phiRv2 integrase [Microbacterium lemovicicum]
MATKRKASRASWGKTRKLPSGRYQASYVAPDGERYNAPMTFSAKTDADTWLGGVRADISRGAWTSPAAVAAERAARDQTLGAYFETWLSTRNLRDRTVDEYRRLFRSPNARKPSDKGGPLAPLAPLALAAITTTVVDRWYGAQTASGTKTQASRAYSLLSTLFKSAVARDLAPSNPCRVEGAQTARTGKKVEPPTDAELATILSSITPRYRALVVVASAGGLRYGEATALRAKDVTIERNDEGLATNVRLNVKRAAVRTAGTIREGDTKTAAGVRSVAIFGLDAVDVAEHVRGLIGDALLFPAADGVSFLAQATFWRHWNDARTAAGRPDMPFHALRHYAGTRYAQTGATPRETMARLGHTSLAVAMRYQHTTDRDDELAARAARR